MQPLGETAVAVETRARKGEYLERQHSLAERAAVLRTRPIDVIDNLLPR